MSIITVSRRPFSRGREVAEWFARKLGYGCVARAVLFEAANRFDIADSEIMRAVHDAPSFSDHFHYGREINETGLMRDLFLGKGEGFIWAKVSAFTGMPQHYWYLRQSVDGDELSMLVSSSPSMEASSECGGCSTRRAFTPFSL